MHMRDISLKPGTGGRFQMSGARRCLACLKEGRGQLRPDFESERLRGSGAEGRRRLQAKHRSVVGGYHGRVTVVNMHQVTNLNNRYKNFFTFDSYNASFF